YFDSPRAIEVLAPALTDDTPRARSAAAQALGSIEGPQARRLLAHALEDSESWVRYFAAISLGRLGDASAFEALGTLARSDAAIHVSVAAIDAIAAIGGDAAVGELAALTREPGDRGQEA